MSAAARPSRVKSALMLAGPPLVVTATLLGLHSVWWTFLAYHILICLAVPFAAGETMSSLGLGRWGARGVILAGLGLGALLFLSTRVGFELFGDRLLGDAPVRAVLEAWGVGVDCRVPLVLFMILVNAPVEEIYWRGFVQPRILSANRPGSVTLTALAYASYHGVTLLALTGSQALAAGLLLAVFGAGCLWGWLRERYASLWPALLGHVGATIGYMLIYWRALAGA